MGKSLEVELKVAAMDLVDVVLTVHSTELVLDPPACRDGLLSLESRHGGAILLLSDRPCKRKHAF